MKKALIASSIILAAGAANADVIGLTAEAGYYMPDATFTGKIGTNPESNPSMSAESSMYYGVAFEHPVPVIPNVRVQGVTFDTKASGSEDTSLKIDTTDYTAYYELPVILPWLELDVGFTLRAMDVDMRVKGASESGSVVLPTGYVAGYVHIPGLPLSIGGELKTLSIGDSSLTDTTIKVKYESPFFVGVEAGYRNANMTLDTDDFYTEADFSGAYIGAFVDF